MLEFPGFIEDRFKMIARRAGLGPIALEKAQAKGKVRGDKCLWAMRSSIPERLL